MAYLPALRLAARDAIDDGVSNPRGESLARLAVIFICISGIIVVARLWTRYSSKSLGPDDALIAGSLALAIVMTVTYNKEAKNGFGLHRDQVDWYHKMIAFKWFFAAQILYKIATCLTKMSICALYLRIFPSRRFHYAVYTVMAVTITYTIIAVFLTIFACHPISKSWNKKLEGTCMSSRSIWYSTSIMIILTDFFIIVLPLHHIRSLKLPLVKKILLTALFGLGVFCILCTIIRMVTVSPRTTAADQIYYQATSNSWTFVEVNVGIICACLPILRLPLSKSLRQILGLSVKGSTNRSKPTDAYVLHSVGNDVRSGLASSKTNNENDSVRELIFDKHGINVTRDFSTKITSDVDGQDLQVPSHKNSTDKAWSVEPDGPSHKH
ncbi:integral membrane protein [Grosmannia clavigera kw1407]|uniref:Integral membrane protein n=1 Tax=Grosmannia clavigera (strain kw1407 / UAMH 11150) TaxID=655863 RepID=F0XKQ5_GROCL|nr:uncharacterized protein CMQ_8165 [Grosmannia clavigera kw1407]EFX01699.1 integral membrane protein [Grosmannia clavigera kw1407]